MTTAIGMIRRRAARAGGVARPWPVATTKRRRDPRRSGGGTRAQKAGAGHGQTLVEFALVLLVFMLVVVGLLDGMRVIFYYSQIQEAAREGARWGSVQVARAVTDSSGTTTTPWGTFDYQGDAAGVYCDYSPTYNPSCPTSSPTIVDGTSLPVYSLQNSRTLPDSSTNTIVGATLVAATAVDPRQATIIVTSSITGTTEQEVTQINPYLTNQSVSVTVKYPFRPILGMVFGGVTIGLEGTSTMLHE